jgi:hypothetical protein
MNKQEIKDLAFNALGQACIHIQDHFGVKTGDTAGLFFSGEEEDAIIDILSRYIRTEIMVKSFEEEK